MQRNVDFKTAGPLSLSHTLVLAVAWFTIKGSVWDLNDTAGLGLAAGVEGVTAAATNACCSAAAAVAPFRKEFKLIVHARASAGFVILCLRLTGRFHLFPVFVSNAGSMLLRDRFPHFQPCPQGELAGSVARVPPSRHLR